MPNDKRHIFKKLFELHKWDMEVVDSVCNDFGFPVRDFWNETTPPTLTNLDYKSFSKDTETSREGNERIFHVNTRSVSKNFVSLELFSKLLAPTSHLLFFIRNMDVGGKRTSNVTLNQLLASITPSRYKKTVL